MKKHLAFSASLLLLVGCASVSIEPPKAREVERSRTYSMPFDATWTRAVDWYADHNVTIEKIQKESGLLTAKYMLGADNRYLDCGNIKTQGFLGDPLIARSGSLNLTVRRAGEERSLVNVNFFGGFDLKGNDSWDGRRVEYEGRCISTGQLEREILDYVERR